MSHLYDQLVEIGAELDNHESDLYVKLTAEVLGIVRKSDVKYFTTFKSQIDGEIWLDLPFQYKPFWDKKASRTEQTF